MEKEKKSNEEQAVELTDQEVAQATELTDQEAAQAEGGVWPGLAKIPGTLKGKFGTADTSGKQESQPSAKPLYFV